MLVLLWRRPTKTNAKAGKSSIVKYLRAWSLSRSALLVATQISVPLSPMSTGRVKETRDRYSIKGACRWVAAPLQRVAFLVHKRVPKEAVTRNLRLRSHHGVETGLLDSHKSFAKPCRPRIAVAFVTQSSFGRDSVRRVRIDNQRGLSRAGSGNMPVQKKVVVRIDVGNHVLIHWTHYGDLATMIQPQRWAGPLSFGVASEPCAGPLFAREPIFSYGQVPLIL